MGWTTVQRFRYIERIGKFQESKQRSLKVNLNNTEDKKSIFNFKKLRNLKGNERYPSIIVTEDYTLAERDVIKTWSNKANEMNEKEVSSIV